MLGISLGLLFDMYRKSFLIVILDLTSGDPKGQIKVKGEIMAINSYTWPL
jgi:hypothetical protein